MPLLLISVYVISVRAGLIATAVSGSILAFYALQHWDSLIVLFNHQVIDIHGQTSNYISVLKMTMYLCAPLLIPILAWLAFNPKRLIDPVVLYCSLLASPLPFYHFINQDLIALYKHMVYPSTFLVLLIAYIAIGENLTGERGWIERVRVCHKAMFLAVASLSMLCILPFHSYDLLKQSETAWIDTSGSLKRLKLRGGDSVAGEDAWAMRYYYGKTLAISDIQDINYFDFNKDGRREYDETGRALQARALTALVLDRMISPKKSNSLAKLAEENGYKLVHELDSGGISKLVNNYSHPRLSIYLRNDAVDRWQ